MAIPNNGYLELIHYKDFLGALRTYERNSQKCGFCGCYKKGERNKHEDFLGVITRV